MIHGIQHHAIRGLAAAETLAAIAGFSPDTALANVAGNPVASVNPPNGDLIHGSPPSVNVFRFNGKPMRVIPGSTGPGSILASVRDPNQDPTARDEASCYAALLANAGVKIDYNVGSKNSSHDTASVSVSVADARTEVGGLACSTVLDTEFHMRFLGGKPRHPVGPAFDIGLDGQRSAEVSVVLPAAVGKVGVRTQVEFKSVATGRTVRETEKMVAIAQQRLRRGDRGFRPGRQHGGAHASRGA